MNRAVLILALTTLLILTLDGCGGGGGGGQTTSATSAKTAGGGITSAQKTTAGGNVPAEMASSVVSLTPSQNSGVSGTATLTNTNSGVQVVLDIQNLQDEPATEHQAHIHQGGTCADDRAGNGAPVEYPLTSVKTPQSGTSTSTTEIPGVTVAQLFSGPAKYINVHAEQSGSETLPGISCADLSTSQD